MITLQWNDIRGYVSFAVASVPDGSTLFRLNEDGTTLDEIVGFSDPATWISGGAGIGHDYRNPIGTTVWYVVAPVGATRDASTYTDRLSIDIPGDRAYLRNTLNPASSAQVRVVTTGTENTPARQFVYEIAGRSTGLVVNDVRLKRRGTVTLFAANSDERAAVEALLSTGDPLLLTMCTSKFWSPCMMAVGNAGWTRFGIGTWWTVDIDYIEVSDHIGGVPVQIVDYSYQSLKDIAPVSGPFWRYMDNYDPAAPATSKLPTYIDIAMRRP